MSKVKPFFKFNDDQDSSDDDSNNELEEEEQQQPQVYQSKLDNADDFEKVKRSKKNKDDNSTIQSNTQTQPSHQPTRSMYGEPLQAPKQQLKKQQSISSTKIDNNSQNPTEKRQKNIVQKASTVLITIVLQLFSNIFFVYPILIVRSLFQLFQYILTCFCSDLEFVPHFINPIILICFSAAVLNVCFETVTGFIRERDIYSIWFLDAFFLFFTKILIFSIIKITKQDNFDINVENICTAFDPGSQNGLVLDLYQEQDDNYTVMDIPLSEKLWKNEYLRIINEELEVDVASQRFNTFETKIKNPSNLQYIGYQLFQGLGKNFRVHLVQYSVLQFIALAKLVACSAYIFYHFQFGTSDILYIVTITLFNINEVYCLNVMLSNQDLRRKIFIANKFNKIIQQTGGQFDYTKILDVTSCESLETWDNSRRVLLYFFEGMYQKLEWSYSCIFLYYLFVFNICLAAYGDINFIIDENSILLNPLIVISSTFSFLFLNTLLLFRLYFGSKYNETIEDSEQKIDILIGIYQDLLQMYDYNFNKKVTDNAPCSYVSMQQNKDQAQRTYKYQNDDIEDRKLMNEQVKTEEEEEGQKLDYSVISCYDSIISKTKFLSNYYVENNKEFLGKVYAREDEKSLQQKLMKNILKSLQRIKSQIQIDQKQHSYKVFNFVPVDFWESLFTILVAIATILPEFIPRFITLFKSKEIEA